MNELVAPLNQEFTIFRAWHVESGMVLGLYTNRPAARAHCEAIVRREVGESVFLGWVPDDGSKDAPEELCTTEEVLATGYYVTPLTVAPEFDEEADE